MKLLVDPRMGRCAGCDRPCWTAYCDRCTTPAWRPADVTAFEDQRKTQARLIAARMREIREGG